LIETNDYSVTTIEGLVDDAVVLPNNTSMSLEGFVSDMVAYGGVVASHETELLGCI
jgi:hypothetical protein